MCDSMAYPRRKAIKEWSGSMPHLNQWGASTRPKSISQQIWDVWNRAQKIVDTTGDWSGKTEK